MVAVRDTPASGIDLDRLAGALESLEVGRQFSALGVERDRLAATIRNYLIPRSQDLGGAPLNVVFAGPTGSGKSTLVNSVVGRDLSTAGALRPTTRVPVVLTTSSRLPDFEAIAGVDCATEAADSPLLESMVLIDTPDIDSTSTEHRVMAEALIDNADIVVFVTSALRYADEVPWQVLRRAVSRGTTVIQVLNRVGSGTSGAVVDFRGRLSAAGLDDQVFSVPEHHMAVGSQRVPSLAVRSLHRALSALAEGRAGTASKTFDRVLASIVSQVDSLVRTIGNTADFLDAYEAELSLDLAGRVDQLDLRQVVSGLAPSPPAEATSRTIRRWAKEGRRRERLTSAEVTTIVSRIDAIVSRDLRQWLVAGRPDDTELIDTRSLVDSVLPALRVAIEGWIDFVSRIAAEFDPRARGFTETVLVEAAMGPGLGSARMLFGDHAEELVGRAQRELLGRLEVVYCQIPVASTDLLRAQVGDLDTSDIRAALGAVRSNVAPVHG